MTLRLPSVLLTIGIVSLLGRGTLHAEPIAELKAFATVKEVNLEKLAGGAITAVRGTALSSPRDMAVESVYVVKKPLAKTAELHVLWSPSKHPELKVYLHGEISNPPAAGQFQQVASAPANGAVKWLEAATQKLAGGAGTEELQMSAAEAKAFKAEGSGGGKGLSPAVASFWSNLLQRRAEAYLGGGLGRLAPYEFKGETIRSSEEMARVLKQATKIRAQFAGLIEATPLGGGKGSIAPAAYWEMFDAEGEAFFNLGAFYYKAAPGTWQAVDTQYYSSGAYCAMLTFYQMWPVTVGGQEATLVWRGDIISSRALASLHGVERLGSSTALMRETQKSIKSLLDDAARAK